MEKHIQILAALHIALSALGLLIAVLVFLGLLGGGLIFGDVGALAITGAVGFFVLILLLVICLPGLVGGIGLLRRRRWSRLVLIIVGALNILNFPFGTALGVYTIWVLTKPEVERILR